MNTSGVGSGGATPQYSQWQLAVVANCRVGTVCFGGHVECRSKEGEKGNNSKDTWLSVATSHHQRILNGISRWAAEAMALMTTIVYVCDLHNNPRIELIEVCQCQSTPPAQRTVYKETRFILRITSLNY